jgi:hypothetical protein
MPTLNFLGLKNSPKLPDPQIYNNPAESNAPEWYPAYTQTILLSYFIKVGVDSFILCPSPNCPYLLFPIP